MEIVLMIGIIVVVCAILVCQIYIIYKDGKKLENNFNIQIAAAQAARRPDVSKMSYDDLIKIVNTVIDYYTSKNLELIALSDKDDQYISIQFNEVLTDTCTQVGVSISKDIKECLLAYITEDFFDQYIYNGVRLMVIANIEKYKLQHKKHNISKRANKEKDKEDK